MSKRLILSSENNHGIQQVSGFFNYEYDILSLDKNVCAYLENIKIINIKKYNEDIIIFKSKLDNTQSTPLQKKYYNKQINHLKNEIDKYNNNHYIISYKEESKKWLELFEKLGGGIKTIVIGTPSSQSSSSTVSATNDPQLVSIKLKIIRSYISIVQKYMPINLIESIPYNTTCPACDEDMKDVETDESGLQKCPKCQFERCLPTKGYCSSTNASLELPPPKVNRYDNEEKDNFMKARMRYEGRQKDKFPSDIFNKLDDN